RKKLLRKKSIRRQGPFNVSACSRFALADCSGQLRGSGLTPSRSCTKWLTARMWTNRTATDTRKWQRSKKKSKSFEIASRNSKQKRNQDGVKAWNSFC